MIDLSGGNFDIDPSIEARKKLAMCLNDNVYKNWEHFSVSRFVNESSRGKHELNQREKSQMVDRLMEKKNIRH